MSQINIGSINNKLNYLENIKSDMRNSLVNKGEVITVGTPFQNYVETIDKLTNTYGATVNSDSIWGENNYAWANNERVYGTMQSGECANRDILNYKLDIFDNYPEVNITKAYGINFSSMFDKKVLPVLNLGTITNIQYPIVNQNTEVVFGVKSRAIINGVHNLFVRAKNLKYIDLNGLNMDNYNRALSNLFVPLKNSCYVANLNMLNTANATNFAYIFNNCKITGGNVVLNWDVSNATSLSGFAYNAYMPDIGFNLIRDGGAGITSSVGIFQNATVGTVNLTRFNLSNISGISEMFWGTTINGISTSEPVLNVTDLDLSSVTKVTRMFASAKVCSNLPWNIKDIVGELKNVENVEDAYMFMHGVGGNFYSVVNNCYFKNLKDAQLMFAYGTSWGDCTNLRFGDNITVAREMFSNSKIRVFGDISINLNSCNQATNMFANYLGFGTIHINNISNIAWADGMFENLRGYNNFSGALYLCNGGNWDFSNMLTMNNMFRNSSVLAEGNINITNIKRLTAGSCRDVFTDMKGYYTARTLNVNIKDSINAPIVQLLAGAPLGNLNIINTSFTAIGFSSKPDLTAVNIDSCDTTNLQSIQFSANPEFTRFSVNNCNLENLTTITIGNCPKLYLLDIDANNSNLNKINFTNTAIDDSVISKIGNWNLRGITNMANTFRNCRNINILNWSNLELTNCVNMTNVFRYSSLREFHWTNVIATNVNMQNILTDSFFVTDISLDRCNFKNDSGNTEDFIVGSLGLYENSMRSNLGTYINIDIRDTAFGNTIRRIGPSGNVFRQININNITSNDGFITAIDGRIINSINISNIKSNNTFYLNIYNANNLETLVYTDIDGSATVGAINLNSFSIKNTPNLKFVNISNIDLSNVESIRCNFKNIGNASVQLLNWNICNCINCSNMFSGLRASNLMIDSWNTSNLQIMSGMFSNTSGFTDESIDAVINLCINSVNVVDKNLFYMNPNSPFYGSGIQNNRYQNRWSDLTNAGWTY